ncbi:calcium uptake protein 2, mitochondrial isoform X2 [Chelonia mydas]|uniref:calcium uptake protein 2, mitochondrial isoform X2 n=1 Tax=Chelonia mydas TaxID=8469 RepID=UPI001CA94F50|nr:calcium uptake protein 2, mitochondrial isoform X2 [Chelonia mydas]
MAAWRAALAVAARRSLRGSVSGLRAPGSQQRRPGLWAVAATLLGGGSLAAGYSGWCGRPAPGGFLTVLAQIREDKGSYPEELTLSAHGMIPGISILLLDSSALQRGWRKLISKEDVANEEMAEKLSIRKQRFMKFASLEYEGEYYMTPRDFLFSVMFDQVGCTAMAKKLTKKEVDAALVKVTKAKAGPTFFRDLGDKEPQTGFHIAFKMLDADGNEQVEKKEFFKLQKIIGKQDDLRKASGREMLSQEPELEDSAVNTTLLVHFFGRAGKEKLCYSEFYRFMENLQTEVQEMEFIQFSKGLNFMRKEDFAEWLLYFTDEENNEIYWQNVRERIQAGENISLDEFKTFCQFTNRLEDFSIAMQMFTVANRPVKLAEFKRAVKVATGQELSDNVLDTVFKIFDLDGDNCLSHGEFVGVLKNRMYRGLRVPQQQGVQGYWKCVKRESIKGAKEVWKQTGKSPF